MHHCCSILFMIFFSSLRHLNIFCHFTNGVTQSLGSSIVIALFRWFTNSKSQIKNSKALGITERSGCFKFRTHTDDTQLRAWVCVCIFRSHTLRTDAYWNTRANGSKWFAEAKPFNPKSVCRLNYGRPFVCVYVNFKIQMNVQICQMHAILRNLCERVYCVHVLCIQQFCSLSNSICVWHLPNCHSLTADDFCEGTREKKTWQTNEEKVVHIFRAVI